MKKKVNKSSFNNDWYNPGGILKRTAWYFINVFFFINPLVPFYGVKRSLLKLFGAKIGERLIIKPGVNIKYPWFLTCGDYVSIGENVWIDNLTNVYLGNHTTISQGAMLLTGNHNYKSTSFDLMVGEITLEEGSWVGAQSVVCPGVTLHSHSILSVASVAASNLLEYSIYQGNPAVKVKDRNII